MTNGLHSRRVAKTKSGSRKRQNFTDSQRAEIFARDRALCCFSGKSLWLLDFGAGPGSAEWADHINPASKGGCAELKNGACASWFYNSLKGKSGGSALLYFEGRPTKDFFTYYETLPAEIASHLRRFSVLKPSDWYFNRAVFHVLLAAAPSSEVRGDGKPFTRGREYWCQAALKKLCEWKSLNDREQPADFESRGLLPENPSDDQQLLIGLLQTSKLAEIKRIASALAPYKLASWKALEDLAGLESRAGADKLLKRVEADRHVVPRVKRAVRHNVAQLSTLLGYPPPSRGQCRHQGVRQQGVSV